jgi:hypothetical protein
MPKWDAKLALKLIPKYVLRLNHVTSFLLRTPRCPKVEGNGDAARAIDDPPVGEFPGVGEDGYQ